MIPINYTELLDKLLEKTKNKEVIWQKTSREDEYKLQLDIGALTIDRWKNDKNSRESVDVNFYNDRGDNIDRLYANEFDDPMNYAYLINLHTEIKRAYYKVDETLKGLLDEIKSSGKIGKLPPESDLPF
jgi:hypothetical protein